LPRRGLRNNPVNKIIKFIDFIKLIIIFAKLFSNLINSEVYLYDTTRYPKNVGYI
jgi:hypothetical protein